MKFFPEIFLIGVMLYCPSMLVTYPNKHVLFSKIEKGGKLKTILSWGNTKNSSKGSYWPASTIKLLPAIAVMRSGIKPNTRIRMKGYAGSVRSLLKAALGVSSNSAYDRLVDLVGQDHVNTTAKQLGLKHTWVSRAYGRKGTFRYSPPYWLGKKYIRAKWAKLKNPKCNSNCTSFKDLQKMILYASKDKELRRWTRRRKGRFLKMVRKYIPSVRVYCKPGYVAYHHGLTNCRFGKYVLTIAIRSGSWKQYWKYKKKKIRLAETILKSKLKRSR